MAEQSDHAVMLLSGSFPRQPVRGKFPAVAVNDSGIVIELHRPSTVSTTIYYHLGSVNGDRVTFTEPYDVGTGTSAKVAINNDNQVIEVHEGQLTRRLHYRIGKVEQRGNGNLSCTWNGLSSSLIPGNELGRFPAVAIYGRTVVITYDKSYGTYKVYYCMGTINENGTNVTWRERQQLFDANASETSVSIIDGYVVAVGRGWKGFVCCVVPLDEHGAPQHNLKREISLPRFGYSPNICLTDNHDVILLWQSFTMRKIKSTIGRLTKEDGAGDGQIRVISFNQTASRRQPDRGFGYNPTLAISPNGKHVLEEHESNFSKIHCTLHYRTGNIASDGANNAQEVENE